MDKGAVQRIAEAAGVSRVTVWKALSGRPGVSQQLRQRIQRAAQEVTRSSFAGGSPAPGRTFSIVVSRPESSSFWMSIIHHAAQELDLHGIRLMYTYMPAAFEEGYTLPDSLSPAATDGLIALNIYDERLLRLLAAQPVPKVFLDSIPSLPEEELNGSLVLLEGRRSVRAITRRLFELGCQRLGFIGDIHHAKTNFDRFLGFRDAHEQIGCEIDAALCLTGPIGPDDDRQRVEAFLAGLNQWPQAFVCAGDHVAELVKRYIQTSGRRFDENCLLTGFDNDPEYPGVAGEITTVDVATAELGKSLARKLIFHADYPSAPNEVSYVATKVLYRGEMV